MRFLKEGLVSKNAGSGFANLTQRYTCSVCEAYYFAGVQAKPLGGKPLPKGKLVVRLEGERLVEGDIDSFSESPGQLIRRGVIDWSPGENETPRVSWAKTRRAYTAHLLMDGPADPSRQIGFMMTNESKIEIFLEGLTEKEKESFDIVLFTALYTTKTGD
jgi:hypothetical protein